jgi:membrane protein DedA with SNARE-associated domain/rhodanese-related sulfurtransferase
MISPLKIFEHHAYTILFGWVLVEQAGVPIPSVPVMVAAGTMSSAHRLHVAYVLPVILLACALSDSMWYLLGKRFGRRILDLLCRFSLESTTCVAKTQGTMSKRGAFTLLFAKFVPGLSTVAAPIAGQAGISYLEFLGYDLLGSLIWASAWLFAGRFFGDIAKRSAEFFLFLRHNSVIIVVLAVVGVVLYKLWKKRQFRTELRGLRLEPQDLKALIDAAVENEGCPKPFIVDLRHPLDVLSDPLVLPGALRIGPEELKQRREMIPGDRDIIVYCTCPSEETSAKVAMDLRRLGIKRVRPLRGGLQGWKDAGYPLDAVESV